MTGLRDAASAIRRRTERSARRAVPGMKRFKVLRKEPLLLDAYGSDLRLGEDDVDVDRNARLKIEKGDDVFVGTDDDGDRVVISVVPGG